MENEITEVTNTGCMVCPYCGYEDYDSGEFIADSDDTECLNCAKEFHYEREYEVKYTTTPF